MNTQEVLDIMHKRGLHFELKEGRLILVKDRPVNPSLMTKLLAVLPFHKDRIIRMMEEAK